MCIFASAMSRRSAAASNRVGWPLVPGDIAAIDPGQTMGHLAQMIT